jgi:hypothetical protein
MDCKHIIEIGQEYLYFVINIKRRLNDLLYLCERYSQIRTNQQLLNNLIQLYTHICKIISSIKKTMIEYLNKPNISYVFLFRENNPVEIYEFYKSFHESEKEYSAHFKDTLCYLLPLFIKNVTDLFFRIDWKFNTIHQKIMKKKNNNFLSSLSNQQISLNYELEFAEISNLLIFYIFHLDILQNSILTQDSFLSILEDTSGDSFIQHIKSLFYSDSLFVIPVSNSNELNTP